MIRGLHLDIAGLGCDDVGQLAVAGEFQDVGTELFAHPEAVGNGLNGFDVEVGARQVTFGRTFHDDGEGSFLVRVGKEHRLQRVDLAGIPVEFDVVEHQHGVAGVELRAETIIGKAPEAAVRHGLDSGKALHGLAVERHGEAGRANAILAGHGAETLGALAVGRRELGGCLEVFRRIGRCCDDGVGGQNGVRDQLCRKLLLCMGCGCERKNGERCEKNMLHGGDPSMPVEDRTEAIGVPHDRQVIAV